MIADTLLTILFIALAAFMSNRLYVALFRKELNVKGAIYSRSETPVAYWLSVGFAALGLLFGLVMSAAMVSAAISDIS